MGAENANIPTGGTVAVFAQGPVGLMATADASGLTARHRDVLLICRSGNRSGSAQSQLQQLGYLLVVNVAGGMNAWSSAGLPVSR